jgi:hypothetical protein
MEMKPGIVARFELDEAGKPQFIASTDSSLKHYKILLKAEAPPATESAVFELHPTYFDPVREVKRSSPDEELIEEITSYGDYEVQLSTSGSVPVRARELLSNALRKGHAAELQANPSILAAIRDIEES